MAANESDPSVVLRELEDMTKALENPEPDRIRPSKPVNPQFQLLKFSII